MFRAAELGRSVPDKEFAKQEPVLRQELLELQRRLSELAEFPVIVVFAGVTGAGKNELVNLMNKWMDPRWLITRAYNSRSDEELERPYYWRYWRDLPPKGQIGLFLSSWYSKPLLDHAYGEIDDAALHLQLEHIVQFEKALTDDGALILKFWMHLGKDQQVERLKALEEDPLSSWHVTSKDRDHLQIYDRFEAAAEQAIIHTSSVMAPWTIVEGTDRNYRSLKVGSMFRDEVAKRLLTAEQANGNGQVNDASEAAAAPEEQCSENGLSGVTYLQQKTVFSALSSTASLGKAAYRNERAKLRGRLNRLHRVAQEKKLTSILVFEGQDAAGKGGAIRQLTGALDARWYQVIPIAAPTDEERAQHYLWRFWRHLSRAGRVTIFDRSWYGRMLVERVESLASEHEWRRAYAEVNHFEDQLAEHGILLQKFWIHVTKDEQLNRFKAREQTPHKRWKLTDEDWRNREKWEDYKRAGHDVIQYTNTRKAPWVLVEGNDKRYARIKVLQSFADRLEEAL